MEIKHLDKECERCTEIIPPNSHVNYLCDHCFGVIGHKTDKLAVPCFYCGDIWVSYQALICSECFKEEPGFVSVLQ